VQHDSLVSVARELAHAPGTGSEATDRLAELYSAHCVPLRRYAESLNHSEEEAADVVQDVFAYLAGEPEVLTEQQNPTAFLFRAVRNHALNRMRGERKLSRRIARYAADTDVKHRTAGNEGDASVLSNETDHWLNTLVDELPDRQREVFRLVRFGGLTYGEAAQLLSVRFSTVHTHMARAADTLASELDRLGLFDGTIRPPSRSTRIARRKMKMRVHKSRPRSVI
jgi:RNA polymerase sigma-70 factor, ECF subfamily